MKHTASSHALDFQATLPAVRNMEEDAPQGHGPYRKVSLPSRARKIGTGPWMLRTNAESLHIGTQHPGFTSPGILRVTRAVCSTGGEQWKA